MKMDAISQATQTQALQKAAAERSDENSAITGVEKQPATTGVDFTHMTRNELLAWGEQQRENGQLSDDAVDALWSMSLNISGFKMTANGQVERALTAEQLKQQDRTEKVDFIAVAEKRAEYARSVGDSANAGFWQQALDMMHHYQGGFTAQA